MLFLHEVQVRVVPVQVAQSPWHAIQVLGEELVVVNPSGQLRLQVVPTKTLPVGQLVHESKRLEHVAQELLHGIQIEPTATVVSAGH
jgi:hypothetical protein